MPNLLRLFEAYFQSRARPESSLHMIIIGRRTTRWTDYKNAFMTGCTKARAIADAVTSLNTNVRAVCALLCAHSVRGTTMHTRASGATNAECIKF